MTHDLIKSYKLPEQLRMCQCGTPTSAPAWQPASATDINRFHTDAYVYFLQQLTHNAVSVIDEVLNHVLNASVCFTETAWIYSTLYVGASLAAAEGLVLGDDIAISLMGGQTHARRDCASGYSYVNDVVLAILHLLRAPDGSLEDAPAHPPPGGEPVNRRVLFVNLDAWHSSGVEEAFYTTDRVCCISLHRYAEGLFPGSGGRADEGMDAGKYHNINLPVADGLDDDGLALLLKPVIAAAAERYCPHCIVCCAGAGVLSGDRLGCLNVSLSGYASVLSQLRDLNLPLLVLGGGGFTQLNAAKAWCTATACLCSVDLPVELPEDAMAALDCYPAHELSMSVAKATMEDMNTPASLEAVRDGALKTIEQMPQRTKPAVRTKRPPPTNEPPPVVEGAEGDASGAATAAVENGEGGEGGEGGGPGAPAEAPSDPAAVQKGSGDGGGGDAEGGGGGGDGLAPMELEATGGGGGTAPLEEKPVAMEAEEPGLGDDE